MKFKKSLSLLMSGVMMCGAVSYLPQVSSVLNSSVMTAQATSKTADEAIAWVKSQVGKGIDYDGAYGNQCVDLILAYYNYLGAPTSSGNAKDYATNTLPSGWSRIAGATPQKGDILVYGASDSNPYGHVAIYESDKSTYHQNFSNNPEVQHITTISYTGFTNPYWGVIRPNWGGPAPLPNGTPMTKGAGQTIPDGDYWINSALSASLYVDPAPGNDVPAAANSNVATWDYGSGMPPAADAWTVKYLNNGFYQITQKGTTMSLDVEGADTHEQTNLQLYPVWGEDNTAQQWSIAKTDKGYTIQSKCSSFFVDSKGGVAESSNIWLFSGNGGAAQLFNFIPYMEKTFKGSGTAESPYQISSADDLRQLADLINNENTAQFFRDKYYVQTADIDLGDEDFTPIGTRLKDGSKGGGFNGVYDGKYHKVTGLNVNMDKSYCGLFGWSYGGTIENLSVYGTVIGKSPTGGIVGEIGTTTLTKIINCSFNGDVFNEQGTVGGIVGHIWQSGYVENCYFNGKVLSDNKNSTKGGIVGVASAGNEGGGAPITVKNCYAVSGGTATGGIIGKFNLENKESTAAIENNYYLKTMADKGMTGDVSKGCLGLEDTIMKTGITELLGKPYVDNKNEKLNGGYPVFDWQSDAVAFLGDGTEESPYLINSMEALQKFSDVMNSEYSYEKYYKAYYKMTCDIDLLDYQFTPIAKRFLDGKDTGKYFCGHFDGGNHTIKNLTVKEKTKFAGLFGSISGGAVIENLAVEGTVVSEERCAGGIVGEMCVGNATVRNCCFIGNVTGANEAVGGVVGYLYQNGTVDSCYHVGTVTCPDHTAGGVVGKCTNETKDCTATIYNCYHAGKVTGLSGTVVGGVGEKTETKSFVVVKNCYGVSTEGALCGSGEVKSFEATQLTADKLKKAAALISDTMINNPDTTYAGGYPVFTWQDKTKPAVTTTTAATTTKAKTTATTTASKSKTTASTTKSGGTTTTAAKTTASTSSSGKKLYGDPNLDGKITVADAVTIMQYLGNKDKYPLTEDAKANGDVFNTGDGLTGSDALTIQKVDAGIYKASDLPVKSTK